MTVQTATETAPFPRATGRQKGYRAEDVGLHLRAGGDHLADAVAVDLTGRVLR